MTELSLEAKIRDLIALAGVLPRDTEHAASNFRALPESEIDRRLDRLRAGKQRLETWRIQQGLKAATVIEPIAARVAVAAPSDDSPRSVFAKRLDELSRLIDRVRAWQPPVPEVLADQIYRRISEFAAWNNQTRATPGAPALTAWHGDAEELQRIMATALKWITRDIEALIRHPLLSAAQLRLTPMETVKALARLENEVTARRPDLLVALNGEGLAIAELVRADLHLDTPLAIVRGTASGQLEIQPHGRLPRRVGRVCVVGHLARTGATMLRTMEYAREWFGAPQVYGTVLAASVDAADRCAQAGKPLYYHYLSAAKQLSVAYDAAHGVAIADDIFVLGDSGSGLISTGSLPIGRLTLDLQRAEVATEFPS